MTRLKKEIQTGSYTIGIYQDNQDTYNLGWQHPSEDGGMNNSYAPMEPLVQFALVLFFILVALAFLLIMV